MCSLTTAYTWEHGINVLCQVSHILRERGEGQKEGEMDREMEHFPSQEYNKILENTREEMPSQHWNTDVPLAMKHSGLKSSA